MHGQETFDSIIAFSGTGTRRWLVYMRVYAVKNFTYPVIWDYFGIRTVIVNDITLFTLAFA